MKNKETNKNKFARSKRIKVPENIQEIIEHELNLKISPVRAKVIAEAVIDIFAAANGNDYDFL